MDTINGHKVIGFFRLQEREGLRTNRKIILVDRGKNSVQRYVTAIHCEGDQEWISGNYFKNQGKALIDFNARCKREY